LSITTQTSTFPLSKYVSLYFTVVIPKYTFLSLMLE
jgi:hypothetical protein